MSEVECKNNEYEKEGIKPRTYNNDIFASLLSVDYLQRNNNYVLRQTQHIAA
jgi:hypothetical protein